MAPTQEEAHSSKPGTACLCCRRRKLKCSREASGCTNCTKAELPCIYPTLETRVKRKRGPYKKKDKPAREAHLEHVVKYLSDPVARRSQDDDTPKQLNRSLDEEESHSPSVRSFEKEHTALTRLAAQEPERASENLVKDALVALTQTSVSNSAFLDHDNRAMYRKTKDSYADYKAPSPKHLMDLWHLFVTRVDPVTKIVHCPTLSSRLSSFLYDQPSMSSALLAVSIYFAAVSSCNADECLKLFGQDKASLLRNYRDVLEQDLIRSHAIPDLENIQALVLYLLCLCREDSAAETWALFSLTVRNAQLIGLHMEPSATFTPYEAELRRRLWWTICSLERSCSEEGSSGNRCLLAQVGVSLPANLEDIDLRAGVQEEPQPRTGITSMSFVLVRWEIMRSNVRLWAISKDNSGVVNPEKKRRMQREFDDLGKHLEEKYLRYCHPSRPFDWLVTAIADVMMVSRSAAYSALLTHQIKCCLTIQHPGNLTDNNLPPEQRLEILRLSVLIIRTGYRMLSNPKCPDYFWFFRSYLQWHSLAIVIAEISHSKDAHFVRTAWEVIKPFANIWDKVYRNKSKDKTWDYVDLLITKAKESAGHLISSGPQVTGKEIGCTSGILPFAAFEPTHTLPQEPAHGFEQDFYNLDDVPLDIDFEALNAVFSSSNWEDALDLQML